jgi:hypothetical protein
MANMYKHLAKQLDREVDSLRLSLAKANTLLNNIEDALEEEVADGQSVVDAKDNHKEAVTSDGTDDIIYGRYELATGLQRQIEFWEKL